MVVMCGRDPHETNWASGQNAAIKERPFKKKNNYSEEYLHYIN